MTRGIIRDIEITRLYNRFNYFLTQEGGFSSAAIFYGENGVGKSTILRLVFHLLSSADNRGHRTALSQIEFERLSVTLNNGIQFTAERQLENGVEFKNLPLILQIKDNMRLLAEWVYVNDRPSTVRYSESDKNSLISSYFIEKTLAATSKSSPKVSIEEIFREAVSRTKEHVNDGVKRGHQLYIETLKSHAPLVFYVNAERRLESDALAAQSDDLELDLDLHLPLSASSGHRMNDLIVRARDMALSKALRSASKWVAERVVRSANLGSTNVHSVYVDVLEHLSNDYQQISDTRPSSDVDNIIVDLDYIERRMTDFEKYEISHALDMSAFRDSLKSHIREQRELSAELIKPYIQSVISRIAAQEPTYKLIDKFVQTINSFLSGKEIAYKLTSGFYIKTNDKVLEPSQLSSGEQQLILMFCYSMTAGNNPSVFMIDEPEISLNVKWQRNLLHSLMDVTSGSKVQFIFASHSMELIAQHRNRVVKLDNSI